MLVLMQEHWEALILFCSQEVLVKISSNAVWLYAKALNLWA